MIEFSNVSITNDFGDYTQYPELQKEEIERLDALREYYLLDLKMMGTGDLFTEHGDIAVTGGLNNLAQALTHRLMTERGSHPMDATLGVPWGAFLGETYSDSALVEYELMQEITAELYKDIRVEDITYISVEFIDLNAIKVDVTVSPTGMGTTFGISLNVQGSGD